MCSKKNSNKSILSSLVLTFIGLTLLFCSRASFAIISTLTNHNEEIVSVEQTIDTNDLERLAKVIAYVKQYYYKPVTEKKLFDNALSGMLSKLDPHSDYLDEQDLKDLEMVTSGKFGGIGIEVMPDHDALRVVSPLDDTPAYKAGIKAGDLIVQINDKLVKDMQLRDAVALMRGPKGSKITLIILRKKTEKPITFVIIRDIIKIESIKQKTLEPNYGYIRISFFQESTKKDLDNALDKLEKENSDHLKGLILDLRNDPGGLLESAIQVSDAFLDADKLKENKLIVYTKGQFEGSEIYAKATRGEALPGVPIVVLINEGSASASEIVAGALQDHKRAIIVGTRSFGKGSVQTLLPIDDKSAIKITTALYYTPNGRSIQAKGIEPNIVVKDIKFPKIKAENLDNYRIDESNLVDHIETPDANSDGSNADNSENTEESSINIQPVSKQKVKSKIETSLAQSDYQLYEALNILKGLNVVLH